MADKIVSWGGFDSKGTDGMGVTGSLGILNTNPSSSVLLDIAGSTNNLFTFRSNPLLDAGQNGLRVNVSTAGYDPNSSRVAYNFQVGGTSYFTIANYGLATFAQSIETKTMLLQYNPSSTTTLRVYSQGSAGNAIETVGSEGTVHLGSNTVNTKINQILKITGKGTTSSTTSLLVQDSNGNSAFEVKDDRSATIYGPLTLGRANTAYIYAAGNNYIALPRQGGAAPGYLSNSDIGDGWAITSPASEYFRVRESGLGFPNGGITYQEYSGYGYGRSIFRIYYTGSFATTTLVLKGNTPVAYAGGLNLLVAGGNSGTYENVDNRGAAGYVTVEGGSATSSSFTTHVPAGGINIQTGLGLGTGSAADLTFSTSTTSSVASTYHTQTQRMVIKGHTGNVGIGTSTPLASLHISGSSNSALLEIDSPAVNNIIYVSGSGNVGIGTGAPAYPLDVNGIGRVQSYFGVGTLSAVSGTPTATPSTTGGTLANGTYFYKIVTVDSNGGTSTGSTEVSATITGGSGSGSVALAWTAVTLAASYRIYRGTVTNTQTLYYSSATNSYTDTGAASTAGTVPTVNSTLLNFTNPTNANGTLIQSIGSSRNSNVLQLKSALGLIAGADASGFFYTGDLQAYHIKFGSNTLDVYNYTNPNANALKLQSTSVNNLELVAGGGNVYIGSPTVAARLAVKGSGTTSSTTALLVQNANASNMLSLTDNGALTINTFQTSSTAFTINRTNSSMGGSFNLATLGTLISINDTVGNSNGSKTTLYINTSGASGNNALIIENGAVGFGTTTPGSGFTSAYFTTLSAGLRVNSAGNYQITSRDTTQTYNTTSGGGISFWGDASGQGTGQSAFAGIRGLKANNTYVNPLGNLAFYVQTGSSSHVITETTFREVARFNELGSFGIGTSSPAALLHISGSSNGALLEIDSPAANNILYVSGSGRVGINTATPARTLEVDGTIGTSADGLGRGITMGTAVVGGSSYLNVGQGTGWLFHLTTNNATYTANSTRMSLTDNGVGFGNFVANGGTVSATVQVRGSGATTSTRTFLLQNSNGTQLGYVDDSGRWQIGQGTNSGYALEVSGSARISSTNSGHKLILRTTGEGSGAGLLVDQLGYYMLDVNASDVYMRPFPSNTAKLDFWSWNSYGGPTNALFIQNSQYHISTDNPTGIRVPIIKFPSATAPIIMGDIATSAIRGYLTVGGTFYASASLGASQRIVSTVSAIANNDTLIGLDVQPTFANGAYTGVTNHALRVSGSTYLYKSGSTVLDVQGSSGQLFSVTDSLSGSLFSVNTVAGLPVIEAFSDNRVNIGKYGNYNVAISGSTTTVTGSLVVNGSDISTAWTSYTPTWTSDGTPPSLGNGTLTGAYKVIGKTCFVRVRLIWGTTTTNGTGVFYFDLPVSASATWGVQMPASILDNGNAWYQATANGEYGGFTNKVALIGQSAGGANSSQGVAFNFPIAFGNLDSIQFAGSYEIA